MFTIRIIHPPDRRATLAAACVCEKNDGNNIDSGFLLGWDSNGVLRLTVEKSAVNMRVATAANAIKTGQWIQVAFTWDGMSAKAAPAVDAQFAHLFVNGVDRTDLAQSQNGSGALGSAGATNQPFRIGNASFDPMAGSLNGRMAYLAIYKGRILTPAEMNQLDTNLPIR